LLEDIKAGHGGGARRGWKKARQHAHGSGLAGAIGPEKADDLPFMNLKGDVVNSRVTSVPLGKVRYCNHKI
jgi:hypothetical protein